MATNYGEETASEEELVQFVRLGKNGGYFCPGIGRIETAYYRLDEADLGRIEAEYGRRHGRDSSEGVSASGSLCRNCSPRGGSSPRGGGSPRG